MKRLTYRTPRFNRAVSKGACMGVECSNDCDKCKIEEIILKLCEYEDTGLTPEEVLELEKSAAKHGQWCAWHGKWVEITTHNGCTPDYDCVCSNCRESRLPWYRFCPNCGAKMDLESEEKENGTTDRTD